MNEKSCTSEGKIVGFLPELQTTRELAEAKAAELLKITSI